MKVIEPKVEILTVFNGEEVLKFIERIGRTCYKSEDRITEDSAKKFVDNLIKSGHESVIEHFNITVKFITDRGISHEIVRHRLASYSQESTRYCNYSKDKFRNEITVIKPLNITNEQYPIWYNTCLQAEKAYFDLLNIGVKPEIARSLLPTCLKTELVMTMNLRELRHFLKLRASKAAHPDIRILAIDLLRQLQKQIPIIFNDINIKEGE